MDKRRSNDNKNKLLYDPNQREQRRLGAFSNEEIIDDEDEDLEEDELDEENDDMKEAANEQSSEENSNNQSSINQNKGNSPIKQVAKNKAKKIASAAGAKAKAVAAKIGAKIVAFIASNPWVLLILCALILLLIIILCLTGSGADDEYGHFDELCDYNLAVVNLTECNTSNTTTMDLGDYVLGATNALIKNRNFSDDAIQAIMILVKTNALAFGGYNSSNKNININTCDFPYEQVSDKKSKLISLYENVNNYLYLASSYQDVVTYLDEDFALELDSDTLDQIEKMQDVSLSNIFDSIYNNVNPDADGYQLYDLADFCEYIVDKNFSQSSSLCDTSTDGANLLTFVSTLEGHTDYCDNKTGYIGAYYNDGTISIGPGLTNRLLGEKVVVDYIDQNDWGKYFIKNENVYQVNVGTCVPVDIIERIKVYALDAVFAKPLEVAATSHGISLTQYQKDALTSFNYNVGAGYAESLINAYVTGGYEGLWNFMKKYYKASGAEESLKKRRKAEFALFVTGDYTDEGKFYSGRSTNDYDNYDSEGVMAKLFECNISSSGFVFPLEIVPNLVCTSPFGLRDLSISTNHHGLDMGGVPDGTPIYAGKSGEVVKVSNDVKQNRTGTGCGNMVRIKHDDGYQTEYCHMYPNSICVSVGEQVSQGQKIGEVGDTGTSTGTHLHIGVIDPSGSYIDPTTVFDLSFLGSRESGCHH